MIFAILGALMKITILRQHSILAGMAYGGSSYWSVVAFLFSRADSASKEVLSKRYL